jgi:hypothetical protein
MCDQTLCFQSRITPSTHTVTFLTSFRLFISGRHTIAVDNVEVSCIHQGPLVAGRASHFNKPVLGSNVLTSLNPMVHKSIQSAILVCKQVPYTDYCSHSNHSQLQSPPPLSQRQQSCKLWESRVTGRTHIYR